MILCYIKFSMSLWGGVSFSGGGGGGVLGIGFGCAWVLTNYFFRGGGCIVMSRVSVSCED